MYPVALHAGAIWINYQLQKGTNMAIRGYLGADLK
jgi:hypothetical protein